MRREETPHHSMDLLFVILLFAVFAGSVLVVLAAETAGYRNLLTKSAAGADAQTAESYVIQKVRQTGGAKVGTFDSASALLLPQEVNGTSYVTVLYSDGTSLRELFCETSSISSFSRGAGEEVCGCSSASFTRVSDGGLILAALASGEGEVSFLLSGGAQQ